MSYYGFLALHLTIVQLKVSYSTPSEENKIKFTLNLASTIGRLLSSVSLVFMVMLLTIQMATTGYEIKKGWHVNIDATCIHYDSDLFIDPLKFNPQRFDVTSSIFLFSLLDCFLPVSENYFTYLLFISAGNAKALQFHTLWIRT
jgi:cytochrome P450